MSSFHLRSRERRRTDETRERIVYWTSVLLNALRHDPAFFMSRKNLEPWVELEAELQRHRDEQGHQDG